jgi:hypothetical protein
MSPEIADILNTIDTRKHKEFLAKASLDQIEEYLRELTADNVFRRMGEAERERRYFEVLHRPHWTVTPTFWLVVVSVILSATAALLAALSVWPGLRAALHLP